MELKSDVLVPPSISDQTMAACSKLRLSSELLCLTIYAICKSGGCYWSQTDGPALVGEKNGASALQQPGFFNVRINLASGDGDLMMIGHSDSIGVGFLCRVRAILGCGSSW